MHWVIAEQVGTEFESYIPERDRFTLVPQPDTIPDWHQGGKAHMTVRRFASCLQYASRIGRVRGDGVITSFGEVAFAVGLQQRLRRSHLPIVAWYFNLGHSYRGAKAGLARFASQRISRFVVHSEKERHIYSELLHVPLERFRFVRFNVGRGLEITRSEDRERPFLLAMGSARRDYRTLFEAVSELKIRTVVVANDFVLQGLRIPDCVEVRSRLHPTECFDLAQEARLSVVPIDNEQTASGQITVVTTMYLARPLIATRCIGTEDYIEHGVTGLLTEPRSSRGLAEAIRALWDDEPRRAELAANARRFALEHLTMDVAGAALTDMLLELEQGVE